MSTFTKTFNNNEVNENKGGKTALKIPKLCPVPKQFPGLYYTCVTDTTELSCLINNLIRPIMPDLKGSKIDFTSNYPTCELYFVDNQSTRLSEGQCKAITSIFNKDGDEQSFSSTAIANIIQFTQNAKNQAKAFKKYYKLTEEAKGCLKDIIPSWAFDRYNKNKIKWDLVVSEGSCQDRSPVLSPIQSNNNLIYVAVKVDLYKLLKMIYGDKADDGGEVGYYVNPTYPIDPIQTADRQLIANKWGILIIQLKELDAKRLIRERGYEPFNDNSLGIVCD